MHHRLARPSLSVMATERLLETMLELKKHDVAQIIISHRLFGPRAAIAAY